MDEGGNARFGEDAGQVKSRLYGLQETTTLASAASAKERKNK